MATLALAFAPGPTLSVENGTLHWTAAGTRNEYRVQVKRPGVPKFAVVVTGTSYLPVPHPGETDSYKVKATHNESAWSNIVSIQWPAGESAKEREEREQREREAKESKEREEREQREREAREAKEREEREQRERETREREERETKEREQREKEEREHLNKAGEVKYRLNAASYYDSQAGNTSFLVQHIDRVLCYVPFCDSHYLPYVPSAVAYHDAYTHWGANTLNPTHRAEYVKEVERDVKAGYAGASGQFMDDIEFTEAASQHHAGTDAEVTALVEDVRRAMPSGVLEINTQYADLWPRMKEHNAYAERMLAVVSHVDKEFGVNSSSGISSVASFVEYLQYVDALHGKGIHIDQADSSRGSEYELGTYLLNNDGGDYIGSHIIPSEWWAGYDTNLGAATTGREVSGALYKRRFTSGLIYVNAPGGTTQTVTLPKAMKNANGETVSTVSLAGRTGAVLHE